MTWNSSEFGGVESVVIHPKYLWTPDILLYNRSITYMKLKYIKYRSADERFDGTYQTNIVVSNDGSMLYVPPGIFKSTCKVVDQLMIIMIFARNAKMFIFKKKKDKLHFQIDITWFPFDDQNCEMKFGSWTYTGFKVSENNMLIVI